LSLCGYSRSSLSVLLCLSAMSVCVICPRCWISAVFFMWVLFCGVLQCGLLVLCLSVGILPCSEVWPLFEWRASGMNSWKGRVLSSEGYGVGDLWLVGFSRASKILLGDMLCSSFRWLFLVNSACM